MIYQCSNSVAAELCPLLDLRRVAHLGDVYSALLLESSHTVGAVAEVGLGILAVHHESVLVPKSARQNHVSVTYVVELNIVNLRNFGNLLECRGKELLHILIARVERSIIRYVRRVVVCRLAQSVYGVPALRLAARSHSRHPCVILQSRLLGSLRRCTYLLHVHSGVNTHARNAVLLPCLEVGSKRFFSSVVGIARPSIHRNLVALGTGTQSCERHGKG